MFRKRKLEKYTFARPAVVYSATIFIFLAPASPFFTLSVPVTIASHIMYLVLLVLVPPLSPHNLNCLRVNNIFPSASNFFFLFGVVLLLATRSNLKPVWCAMSPAKLTPISLPDRTNLNFSS